MASPTVPSFDDVKYGRYPSSCSPQFEASEPDGIKIAAPAVFHMAAKDGGAAKLPLCVTLRFNDYYLSKFQQVFQVLQVIIVDDDNQQVRSGGIWKDRFYLPDPPSPMSREELEKRIAWEYSTVNLLDFFPLPKKKARYHRGLDRLRKSGWRGSGYVRWSNETNRGFLRALEGLRSAAEAIGEIDEAQRCDEFLYQLDPGWDRRPE